jgi:hypothetical protein
MFTTEMHHVFVEAKDTFIGGHYVSTLLLGCAFFEHTLSLLLEAHGHEKQARAGLKAIIDGLRKHRLVDDYLLTQVDRLRERRNPFVHLKGNDQNRGIPTGSMGSIRSSGLNTTHLSRLDCLDRGQHRWNERKQVFERAAVGAKYDNAEAPLRDVLLKLEVLVAGQEHREPSGLCSSEQFAVLETCP